MRDGKIYFSKLKENAIIPSKREEDGAFDIYACFEESYRVIMPHETALIPTGIASAFSSSYVAVLRERGSNGSVGIGQRAGVIDSGFRGEWFVIVTNHNTEPILIKKEDVDIPDQYKESIVYPYNKAISQCIMLEIPKLVIEEINYETLKTFESERGVGMLGSSGK